MHKKIQKLVVIGAGSAGWLAALYAKKSFPNWDVTVIGSTEIGIIGAGEGTVPLIHGFLNDIDLDVDDVIKNCKGTQKLGIKYVGWGDKKTFDNVNSSEFYHAFKLKPILPKNEYSGRFLHLRDVTDIMAFLNNKKISDYNLEDVLCDNKLCGIPKNSSTKQFEISGNAVHFDANLLAAYLKSLAPIRGIKYVDDIVEDFILNEEGEIETIVCKNKKIECDFVFDCSGFRKLVTGKLYKTKWIDLQDRLPVKKAIPFFLPPDKEYENYTTATAMDYGWCWKIPLQHRSGCGYVFDSDLCDDETAIKELTSKVGHVEINRTIKFDAGFYEKSWVKNSISFGLSSGFVEPLEATSLMVTMLTVVDAVQYLSLQTKDEKIIGLYNSYNLFLWNEVVDFVQYHYLNKRDDTEFWRRVNCANKSDSLEHTLECLKVATPQVFRRDLIKNSTLRPGIFDNYSWLRVGLGINIYNEEMLKNYLSSIQEYYNQNHLEEISRIVNSMASFHDSHEKYLTSVVGEKMLMENRTSIFKA